MDESVAELTWAGDGGVLFAGSADGVLSAYGGDGDTRFRVQAHSAGITRVRPQPGGEQLASAGEDGRVRLWRQHDGSPVATVATGPGWADHLAWSPDGRILASAAGGRLFLHPVDGATRVLDHHPGVIGALAWSPGGRHLATAANKGLYLWEVDCWEPVRVLRFPGAAVSLAWSTDGRVLAAGTQDGFVHMRVQGPGQAPRQLSMSGYQGKVLAVDWLPDRHRIATCGGPEVVLWDLDLARGQRRAVPLRRHDRAVTALAYSADGALLASADRNGRLCLWDPGGSPADLELGVEVTALAWQPQAAGLAVGSVDGMVRVLRVPAGRSARRCAA
jgi:WD40 repeat protein